MNPTVSELAEKWRATCRHYPERHWSIVQAVVVESKADIASQFYSEMLEDLEASFFLSSDIVHGRLSKSMQGWLVSVFSAAVEDTYDAAVELQQRVGEIHARINIPAHLVIRGLRSMTRRVRELLADHHDADEDIYGAAGYAGDVMILATEIMCQVYGVSHEKSARAEEGYRLFSLTQNLGAERQRQRASLLQWENQVMFNLSLGEALHSLPKLSQSDFGLWFVHKAAHAFNGSNVVPEILREIEAVEALIAEPAHADGENAARIHLIRAIRTKTKSIEFLVEDLFQQAQSLESGRDTLTQLLNRKYLQTVMTKEVAYALKTGTQLAVLVADVDNFKGINDQYGHDTGDFVLQQIGSIVASQNRGGDYTFRLGGEEFLVVLTDVKPDSVMQAAEALRRTVELMPIPLGRNETIAVTVSVGVALHDGHPDFYRLLKKADQALYQAKALGRNQCAIITD